MTSVHEQKIQQALEDLRTKKFASVSVIHWLEQEEEDTLRLRRRLSLSSLCMLQKRHQLHCHRRSGECPNKAIGSSYTQIAVIEQDEQDE
jgi:hypothetical protein